MRSWLLLLPAALIGGCVSGAELLDASRQAGAATAEKLLEGGPPADAGDWTAVGITAAVAFVSALLGYPAARKVRHTFSNYAPRAEPRPGA